MSTRHIVRRNGLATVLLAGVLALLGSSAGAAPAQHVAAPAWVQAGALTTATGGLNQVSCSSSTQCLLDDAHGAVSTVSPATGIATAPTTIDGTATLEGASCPTTSFCAVVDEKGNALTETDGTWSAPVSLSPSDPGAVVGLSVSCTSATFCLTVGTTPSGQAAYAYLNQGVWTSATEDTANSSLVSVSCASQAYCMMLSLTGSSQVFSLDDQGVVTVGSLTPLDPSATQLLTLSVACPQAGLCVAGSAEGQVFVYNNAAWSDPDPVFSQTPSGIAVSCANATCVVMDTNGEAVAAPAPFVKWSVESVNNNSGVTEGLSCYEAPAKPNGLQCLGSDYQGFTYTVTTSAGGYTPSFGADAPPTDAPSIVNALTCWSATTCLAGDQSGRVTAVTKGVAGAVALASALPFGVTSLGCPTAVAHACEAVAGEGSLAVENPATGTWHPAVPAQTNVALLDCSTKCETIANNGVTAGMATGRLPGYTTTGNNYPAALSCAPGRTTCVALDANGATYLSSVFGTWSRGPALHEPSSSVTPESVSCPSTTFCVAVDSNGTPFYLKVAATGVATWSSGSTVSDLGLSDVSCGATYYCVALDASGNAFTYTGATWLKSWDATTTGGSLNAVACASATQCWAASDHTLYSAAVTVTATRLTVTASRTTKGRTSVNVVVTSATSRPTGTVTVVAGTAQCTVTLTRSSATVSRAACSLAHQPSGPTTVTATFTGAYGFAPASASAKVKVLK